MSAPPFVFPENVRYECLRCGDGCRTYNVLLGPGEEKAVEGLDWQGKAEDLVGAKLTMRIKDPAGKKRTCLKRRADGACVFLGEENQCRIHEHFGPGPKPLLCRLYPFGFYPMGDKIGVDVSFTCRAVAEGRGENLAARVPEWREFLGASDGNAGGTDAGRDTGKHRLKSGVRLPAAIVWEIEHAILQFLNDATLSLTDRLRAAVQYLEIATTGDPAAPTAAQLRDVMAKGIPAQIAAKPSTAKMDKTQRAVFHQWLFLHLNPPPYDLSTWSEKDQQAEKSRRLQAGRRHIDRKGHPWVDNRELGVTFKQIARVGAAALDEPPLDELLVTYLRAKILGQRFLIVGEKELPLVQAMRQFLLTAPMTAWTAKAFAAERGGEEIAGDDIRRALRLVDRSLGSLPTSALPKPQAEACNFIFLETDVVEAAMRDLLRQR